MFSSLIKNRSVVELPFLLPCIYILNYTLWPTDVIKCNFRRTVLLIVAPQLYANVEGWRITEVPAKKDKA